MALERFGQVTKSLKKTSKDASDLQRLIKRLETLDGDRSANFPAIEKVAAELDHLSREACLPGDLSDQLAQCLHAYRESLKDAKAHSDRAFALELESLIKGIGLDLSGHLPKLRAGLYTLEVDDTGREVNIWFGHEQELLGKALYSAKAVVRALERINKDTTGRPLDESLFLKQLHEAYRIVLARNSSREGERAPIVEVLASLSLIRQGKKFQVDPSRENYSGYSRAYFAYDLFRLRERRLLGWELRLGTATRALTRTRADFVWVPGPSGGTPYSHLWFAPTTEGIK